MVDSRPSPRGTDFTDPLSEAVHAWLNDFAKAAKGMRVYAENNEMLQKYLNRAYDGLTAILAQDSELDLSIREDRILYGKDAVHINADREEGLPFIFYRNAFRRVTLVHGMSREELVDLLRAMVTDYVGFNAVQDDLVTTLWRLALPHLRYLTIDAISAKGKTASVDERDDINRIQGSIEDIVAAIYKTDAADDDIVAGVSITKEDLEALKEIREESAEDLDMLDQATERAIADISRLELQTIQTNLEDDDRDHLTNEMLDILVRMLFRETSSRESGQTIELLQRLFDALVLGQQYVHATSLIDRLKHVISNAENMQEVHISRHLLRMFASESRVMTVMNALNEGYSSVSATEKITFLRSLGQPIVSPLLGALEVVTSPAHRRVLCELIVEFGIPDMVKLMEVGSTSKWFVVRDLLGLAQQLPPERISPLIKQALEHDHPKVRAYAVGMLRVYARGMADTLLVHKLADEDFDVRVAAIRVAAARKSLPARAALETSLSAEDLSDREPRELRMAMAAYATIAGTDALPLLDRILNPGFFAGLKSGEPQIAAAFALGSLGPPGVEALSRGGRSLNSKVRDACKRALSRKNEKGEKLDKTDGSDEVTAVKVPGTATKPRATLTGIPSDHSDPVAPLSALTPDGPDSGAFPTPYSPNTADITFSAESGDELDGAPPFYLYDPTIDESPIQAPASNQPLFSSGPAVSAVMTPYPQPDRIPTNRPPAPTVRVEVGRHSTDDLRRGDVGANPTDDLRAVGRHSTDDLRGAEAQNNRTDDLKPYEVRRQSTDDLRMGLQSAAGSVPDYDFEPPRLPPVTDIPIQDPIEAPPEPQSSGFSPPSAAGAREEMPSNLFTPLEPEPPAVPDWVNEAFHTMSAPQEATQIDLGEQSADRAPRMPPPSATFSSKEMQLDINDLTDRSIAPPPPRRPPPSSGPPSGEMQLDIGELADRGAPMPAGPSAEDIPTADEVMASLFAEAPPTFEGEQPLDADHSTGDIVQAPANEGHAPQPDLDAPYIPTVDSDPFATPDGQPPPPKSRTWSDGSDRDAPKPIVPWVDDLVIDDDKGRGS